ncbi:MAG: hypothetical protein AAGK77_03870 [Pseudomonadota bacterium]
MLFLLLATVVTAIFTLSQAPDDLARSCSSLATYPVERLADAGDAGAMVHAGGTLIAPGCDAGEQARGARYLAVAAAAGRADAQFALGRMMLDDDQRSAGLALMQRSAAAGHEPARRYLAAHAAPRDGGYMACMGLLRMHFPFEDETDGLDRVCR